MSLNINAALFGTLRRMHAVQRYSSLPVVRPENVAEHSWQVAALGYMIAMDLANRRVAKPRLEAVLVPAILHDLSESLSGDIIRSYKHSSRAIREAMDKADDLNVKKLGKELGDEVGDDVYREWRIAKDGSLEGRIVALSDMLCVVSYCVAERELGSHALDHVLKDVFETHLSKYHRTPEDTEPLLFPYVADVFPNWNWRDAYRFIGTGNFKINQPEAP